MDQQRLARVIRNMEQEGLTQIVVSSTASVYYLTGVWVEPLERMLALYIRTDGTCKLFGNALFGFWVVAFCLLLLPIFHYLWHGQGSKSIYLMRRLPRRSELWRRCLAGPAVLLGLTLLAGALTLLLCFACYRSLTPAGHLPEDLWAGIGGISC